MKRDSLIEGFAPDQSAGCRLIGHEQVGQESLEIWQHITPPYGDDSRSLRMTWWFAPNSGEIAKWECSVKDARTNGQWSNPTEVDGVERNAVPPKGTFSTEPPSGYLLENTKRTAPLATLQGGQSYKAGSYKLKLHVGFVLPDRTVVLGWSIVNHAAATQKSLFDNLVAGGPLPDMPATIDALVDSPAVSGAVYSGRHLAWTSRRGRFYEWSLYIRPDSGPRKGGNYQVLYRIDGQDSSSSRNGPYASIAAGSVLQIRSEEDFDEFVRGAMAELSDNGSAPEGIAYEGVLQLCEQIRPSLQK